MSEDYTREQHLIDMASMNDGKIAVECASKFVRAIGYDMKTHVCVCSLDYKGKVTEYVYPDMAWEEFVKWDRSESKGVHYNDWIKPFRYKTHTSTIQRSA